MADIGKVTFTNTSDGPRGVNGVNGFVLIEAGEKAEVEVTEAEYKSALSTGYFGKAGDAVEPGPLDQSVDELTAHIASLDDADEVQRLLDAETAGKSRKGALAALEARRDELLA